MAVPHEIKGWPDFKNSSVLPIASLSEAISEFILIKKYHPYYYQRLTR
ncbi:Uncharacterised protein [Legionella pneumophila]|nr:Uncharacterised protein [Legionella pneumophila]STX83471.1 Uncharacterised protein [Legionella pneumophila]